jgi:hypothetical protein
MIGATVDDLALFRQVLAPGPQRVLDRAHRLIEDGAFPPTGRLRTRRSIAGTPASSASAMSVTVAPEARAFAISGQVALTSWEQVALLAASAFGPNGPHGSTDKVF